MPSILFEQHLRQGLLEKQSDTPFLDEEASDLAELLRTFAKGIDETSDLGTAFDVFCEYFGFDATESECIRDTLVEITEAAFGGQPATDDNVKSLLQTFHPPFPKAKTTSPNSSGGMTPLNGEIAVKNFLKKLTVAAHPDPYGNQRFDADKYKAFDREANRYGRNYSAANDYNNQYPSRPLKNPTLNVAFEAVDSIGMGIPNQYRVVNKYKNEYVTRQMTKEEAGQVAADLNDQFFAEVNEYQRQQGEQCVELDEVSKQILGSYIRKSHIDARNKQSDIIDRNIERTTSRNAPWGQIDGANQADRRKVRNRDKGIGKATDRLATEQHLPQTELQEDILKPISSERMNQYLGAFKKNNWTMGGSVAQSDYSAKPARDFVETQNLINECKERFGEHNVSEADAIRSQQLKNLLRKK